MASYKTRARNLIPFAASMTLASAGAMAQTNLEHDSSTVLNPPATEIADASNASVSPSSASNAFGDIIVTAQKRSQSINDVGMSINAVSSEALRNQHLSTTADLTRVVPALSVVPGGASIEGAPVYTLRGIGFNARNLSGVSAVAVYVDEVPLPYPYMTAGPLVDIQRVEVLKGPQGTLYGQNSTGGTINYIANKPTNTFEAGGEATYGRFNTVDVDGYVSGPITDTLAARVAGRSIRGDGWQESVTSDQRFAKQRQVSGRFLLDWTPTSDLRFEANINGFRDRSGTQAFQVVGLNPAIAAFFPADIYYQQLVDFPKRPDSVRAADEDPNGNFVNHNNFVQGSIRGDWDIGANIKLTSISAYSDLKIDSNRDLDGTPYFISTFHAHGFVHAIDQELRLSGKNLGNKLNWIVGGNFSRDIIREDNHNPADGTTLGQALGIRDTHTEDYLRRKSWAAFANADYQIGSTLSFSGGIRYTNTRMNFNGCTLDPGDGTLSAVFGGTPGQCVTYLNVTGAPGAQGRVFEKDTEHNVAWRAGLNYKPSRYVLLYANISRGYKSGDIPSITALVESQLQPVKQEKVTAYEVGTKLSLLDGQLQVKAAAFHYDYVNKQLQTNVDTFLGHAEQTVNVPKSRVNGAELEIMARPSHGLTIGGAGGYTNTRIKKFATIVANTSAVYPPPAGFNQDPFEDVSGSPFNLAPKWQVNGDAQYDYVLANGLDAFVGASVTYSSDTKPFVGASSDYDLKAHTLLDLRLGIKAPNDKWRVMLFGKNVTNAHYYVGGIASFDDAGLYAGAPATYGITVGFNFR